MTIPGVHTVSSNDIASSAVSTEPLFVQIDGGHLLAPTTPIMDAKEAHLELERVLSAARFVYKVTDALDAPIEGRVTTVSLVAEATPGVANAEWHQGVLHLRVKAGEDPTDVLHAVGMKLRAELGLEAGRQIRLHVS